MNTKEYHKEYRKNNPDKCKAAWKRYYEKNKEELNKKKSVYQKERYAEQSSIIKQKTAKRREEAKRLVMTHYGLDGEPKCVECKHSNLDALCIDHIGDNGSEDRKESMGRNMGGSGSRFYFYLIKNGLPDGYQTLCANCNLSKEINRKRKQRGY